MLLYYTFTKSLAPYHLKEAYCDDYVSIQMYTLAK